MTPFYLLLCSLMWHINYNIIHIFVKQPNISKNINHTVNALQYIIFYKYTNTVSYYCSIITASFYIYDSIFLLYSIFKHTTTFKKQQLYFVHHFIACYSVYGAYSGICTATLSYYYYISEISNLMIYFVYHLLKVYPTHKQLILYSQIAQFIWFNYFRIVCGFCYIIFKNHEWLTLSDYPPYMVLFVIFNCLNIGWSYMQFRAFFNFYKCK
jgi:hypothetical protein